MKLTKVEEQGLRLVITLARNGNQITLYKIAEQEQLSEALVAKVLGKLRQGGVVTALRGRNGGYELKYPPEQLSVASILRAVGRPLVRGCFNTARKKEEGLCPHDDSCGLRPIWNKIDEQVTSVLEQIKLSDLLKPETHVQQRIVGLI